jgi:hypothetical protein
MLAMKPQNNCGCWVISSGPGATPCTISTAIRIACTGPSGTPSASIGTKAPEAAALLADSGPATPSTAPLPNCSGWRESRFSTAYDTNDDRMCAEPGMIPIRKPITVPRPIGPTDRRTSSDEGISSASRGRLAGRIPCLR